MFTLPPSLISWASLQIFRILWLWSAVCMTDGIPDGCITLVLPCPALTHTYVKMPQILYVSQYTFVETLLQCLIMHGLQAEQDTHTRKCLKSCMCLSTRFLKPCYSALKRVVSTHGQTHIRKNASNPVCVSVHNFRNPATVPYNAWSASRARHTYAKMPQILYVSQYCKSSLMADNCVVCC